LCCRGGTKTDPFFFQTVEFSIWLFYEAPALFEVMNVHVVLAGGKSEVQ